MAPQARGEFLTRFYNLKSLLLCYCTGSSSASTLQAPHRANPTLLMSCAFLDLQSVQYIAEELLYDDDADAAETTAQTSRAAAGQSVTLQELRTALLNTDLRKAGAGWLPDDVNRVNSSSIKGPLVLQVGSKLCSSWHARLAVELDPQQMLVNRTAQVSCNTHSTHRRQ